MQATAQNPITVSLCGTAQTVTFDGGPDDRIKGEAVGYTTDYDVLKEARELVQQIAARWQGDPATDDMTQLSRLPACRLAGAFAHRRCKLRHHSGSRGRADAMTRR